MDLVKSQTQTTIAVQAAPSEFDEAWDLASELFYDVEIEREQGNLLFKSSRAYKHHTPMPNANATNATSPRRELYNTIDATTSPDLPEEEVDLEALMRQIYEDFSEAEIQKIEAILSTGVGTRLTQALENTVVAQHALHEELQRREEAERIGELLEELFDVKK